MRTKTIAAVCAAALSLPWAHAYNVGTAATFSSLVWSSTLNAPLLFGCSQMVLDGTGDLDRSNTLVIAGVLNCPSLGGGYGVTGSLYLAVDGSINMTFLTAGYTVACPRIVNWIGPCSVIDAQGNVRGTGSIRLL